VFTIVVLTSGDKHKTDILTIDFDPKKRNSEGVKEIPHKVVYLCPKYVNEDTPEPYREWLQAINDSLDEQVEETAYQCPAIQRVFELIEQDTISPTERAKMKDEYGFEEIKRGKYEEGLKDGVGEGQYQAQCRIARRLLTMGIDLTVIAQATGLTASQLQQIMEET